MPKKLLLINDFLIGGGAEIVAQDHAKIFEEHGWQVKFLVGAKSISTYRNKLTAILLNIYGYTLGMPINLFKIMLYKPDIIHVYNWYHLLTPGILVSLWLYKQLNKQVRIFYSAHDYHLHTSLFPDKRKSLFFKIYRTIPALLFYKFLKLVCIFNAGFAPSQTVASIIQKTFNSISCKKDVYILYNPLPQILEKELLSHQKKWCTSSKMIANQSSETNKTKIQAQNQKNIVAKPTTLLKLIFVGRVSPDKQVYNLIQLLNKVIKQLHKQSIDLQLTIVGDGQELNKIRKIKNKVNFKLHILGRKPLLQVPAILQKNHILIMNSKNYVENAPLVMREASIANLYMLVKTDNGGMSEYGKKLNGTFFFQQNNASTLLQALQKLAKLIGTHTAPRSAKQLQQIRKMFSPTTFYTTLIKYYK